MQSTLDGKVIRLRAPAANAGAPAPRHIIPAHLRLALPTRLVEDGWWLSPPVRPAQVLPFPTAACRAAQSNVVRLCRPPGPRS